VLFHWLPDCQERMLTRRYPRHTGEYFTYSYFLVFTNRFWTLIMAGFLWLYFKPRRSQSTVIYEFSFPSISNMLSSWCQYEALQYVSFPATTLFKSFKLAPVMAMGKILGNKSCEWRSSILSFLYLLVAVISDSLVWSKQRNRCST
jgi:solute carrier family 35 (adenosine 3'-phospho 5'-phosphosulfate transporter), member B2